MFDLKKTFAELATWCKRTSLWPLFPLLAIVSVLACSGSDKLSHAPLFHISKLKQDVVMQGDMVSFKTKWKVMCEDTKIKNHVVMLYVLESDISEGAQATTQLRQVQLVYGDGSLETVKNVPAEAGKDRTPRYRWQPIGWQKLNAARLLSTSG